MPAPTRAVALTGSMRWVARPMSLITTSSGSAVDCSTPRRQRWRRVRTRL